MMRESRIEEGRTGSRAGVMAGREADGKGGKGEVGLRLELNGRDGKAADYKGTREGRDWLLG